MRKIFIIAGEPSGDLLGQRLIKALLDLSQKDPTLGELHIVGVGGPKMASTGIRMIASYLHMAVIGIVEVLSSIPRLWLMARSLVKTAKQLQPDIIITIDYPGFNFRLVKQLRRQGIDAKYIHYVAPTVWAYKPERAQKVAAIFDHILLLFSFEQKYFQHMPHTFVGHPILEENLLNKPLTSSCTEIAAQQHTEISFTGNSIPDNVRDIKIAIMPGSRWSEIKRHLKYILPGLKTLELAIQKQIPASKITFVIPTLPHVKERLQVACSGYSNIILENYPCWELIQSCDLALVKIGTSILEVMQLRIPMISFYRAHPITTFIMKMALTLKFFSLPNIIADKLIIPELIQNDFNIDNVVSNVMTLLKDEQICIKQIQELQTVLETLDNNQNVKPSYIAASIVLNLLKNEEST